MVYRPRDQNGIISRPIHLKYSLKELGKPSYEEKVVFALFLSLAILWITRSEISSENFTFSGWASFSKARVY
jgi:di/tricarboxylate transporter